MEQINFYCYIKQNQKYGHVAPKQVHYLNPWDEVCVDMIGPWKVTINQFEYTFRALTCIDPFYQFTLSHTCFSLHFPISCSCL